MRRARPAQVPRFTAFRVAMAAAFGLATAAAGYAWVRAIEAWMFPQVDPRAVVAVTQSGYVTRCAVAAVIGGMGAFGGWALAANARRASRALGIVVGVAAAGIALQTGLLP